LSSIDGRTQLRKQELSSRRSIDMQWPIEYHFYRKIRNSEKIGENPVNSETKSGEAFS